MPFGYFSIDLWSTDRKAHSVQLYSDISGGEYVSPLSSYLLGLSLTCVEIVSGPNTTNALKWNTTVTSTLIYHQANLMASASLVESDVTILPPDDTQFFAFRTVSEFTVMHFIDSVFIYLLLETFGYMCILHSDGMCAHRPPEFQPRGNLAIQRCAETISLRLANWKMYRIPTSGGSTIVYLLWLLRWTWVT